MFTISMFTSNVCAFVRSCLVYACEYVCTLVCRDASGVRKLWGRWLSPCRGSTSPKRSRNNSFVALSSTANDWQRWPLCWFYARKMKMAICLPATGDAVHTGCWRAVSLLRLNDSDLSVGDLVILTQLLSDCAAVKELLIRCGHTDDVHSCSEETKQYLTVCLTRDCSVNNWMNEGINK